MKGVNRILALTVAVTGCAAVLLGTVPPARAENDCNADVQATYRRDDVRGDDVYKIFVVNITSPEPCAKVYFDLVTTERLFDGEEITSRRRDWRKVTSGPSTAFPIKYQMPRDSDLIDWEVKLVRCVLCGTE